LITFFGSNVANNQPVMMKYLYHAKKAGTQIALVNPYREPNMEAYWIPSDLESAMFGTRFTDHFFQVRAGGDQAFLYGAAKHVIENGWHDADFIRTHTQAFELLKSYVSELTWAQIERESGVPAEQIKRYAQLVGQAKNAIFVWGMGITQHTCGEDNVQAIINLALLKGFVGRPGCGLMPIRGHSSVQGGAEMGAYATAFPGGVSITPESAAILSEQYGFDVPSQPGMTTPEMLAAAQRGEMDMLFAIGGNFREVMPDPHGTTDSLGKIPLRVHMDITLSNQMLVDPADTVILLPAMTRYEIPGGVTETSTERRVIFSPEIPGPRIAEARSEWDVLGELAARIRPNLAEQAHFRSTAAIRAEIAVVVPMYSGIEKLRREGDQFQYGGNRLCDGWRFPTPDGKAHFYVTQRPAFNLAEDEFTLVTRRGKQFNSIVHENKESATGFGRDSVLINPRDADRLGFRQDEPVFVVNDLGRYLGKIVITDIAPGSLQVYWPEANILLSPDELSPLAKIPAYKSGTARLEKVMEDTPATPVLKV
jgi:molybdopterin-dependent oxidoreductase alpha subunit